MEYEEIDVWLEIGREGRPFTYIDGLRLGVDVGDLVAVRLRGRSMNGLVIKKRNISRIESTFELKDKSNFLMIERIIQKAAVEKEWQKWLDSMALSCHISPFKMLKAAFPPGWLGSQKRNASAVKRIWWVKIEAEKTDKEILSKRQKELEAFLLSAGGGMWLKDLNAKGFSTELVNKLIFNGYASREKKELACEQSVAWSTTDSFLCEGRDSQTLTDEQKNAINLFESISLGSALLLWGVTGSGKTEVYLQIAAKELIKGRHCLILTPEIGLIPQLVDRFRRRFGDRVLEYHSHCSNKERISTWKQVLNPSQSFIVIGTRSAVFLPLSPLGLIVLDEEHDSSYKQESPMPCYHARDMALDRAKRINAKVILGSATPSLSTWKRLIPDGSIALAKLTHRISKKPLPSVYVIDMREELARGNRGLLSFALKERLFNLNQSKEQAVILVPKRGYNSFLSCRSCGQVVQCPHCDVALTVHRGDHEQQSLRCHWCDYRTKIDKQCKECGSIAFKPFGAGTQRVMEHLRREFGELKFLRFDRDSTSGRDGHRNLLEKFALGEADVLVGTQMLAKGMDLPKVTLAVVLAADGLLYRPDLSAEEQALQLFMQLAGRAGRGELPGEVLVQTYCPEHPVIKHLQDGRYEEFLKKELKLRFDARLFPYSRACLLRISGISPELTSAVATKFAERLMPSCRRAGWNLIGPTPALVARVAGKTRWQILLHGPELSPLPLPQGTELWDNLPKGISLSIDPDPLQL